MNPPHVTPAQKRTILETTALHPVTGCVMQFTPYRQDRRQYYRLGAGVITTAEHALAAIDYWREKGWITIS